MTKRWTMPFRRYVLVSLAVATMLSISAPSIAEDSSALDIELLTEGVRDTRSMSLIAKLEVKSRAERLIDDMAEFHRGQSAQDLSSLEARFDALLDWLVSLVSPQDPELHDQLVASRAAIWEKLRDPASFAHRQQSVGDLRN